jgi:glycerol-1-phosphate dehydrogenase [NAD(P)+]
MHWITGQTNVVSFRVGSGSLKYLGQNIGRFVVTSTEVPWKIAQERIGATPENVYFIESLEQHILDEHLAALPPCDSIVAIGDGKAVDAGKYFAWKKGLRLITVPTVLSADAFVTPAAGVRHQHQVVYIGESKPDPLVIDYDVIRTAPKELNIAGIGDLLAAHTATFDWELAHSQGKSEYPLSQSMISRARGIISDLFAVLPEIAQMTDKGIDAIVEGYLRMNAICLPASHWRAEEGSEHYVFYELEERLQRPLIHGHIIGLGIYLMSRLQKNQHMGITQIMKRAGLPFQPAAVKISYEQLLASLLNLKSYVQKDNRFWYTVINHTEITKEWAEEILAGLSF